MTGNNCPNARRATACLIAGGLALLPVPACAGPPFLTDDPEPTELNRWEIYGFLAGTHEAGQTATAVGLDFNYGAARDVQLSMTVPFEQEPGDARRLGDVEVAAKFKLLHQREDTASLDVTVFPRLYLPSGAGSHHVQVLLPVWAQRDFGAWSLFGGGGYTINPGAGNRDFWQGGIALIRQVRPGFQLGAEFYHQGPTAIGERPLSVVNLAGAIHLSGPVSLIGSVGKGINREQTIFYSALKFDL